MGQKVNPIGLRVGIIHGWQSNWFAKKKQFPEFLLSDLWLRTYIKKKYYAHGITRVYIERKTEKSVKVTIYTAKPGQLIGHRGADVEGLRKELEKIERRQVFVNVKEVKDQSTNATLVAENIALQLEKRVAFRRAIKQSIQRAMRMRSIKGIKVRVAGRLGGSEMAREEWAKDGRIPLHTLRADIEYGTAESHTTFGVIGVKCWVFRGEVEPRPPRDHAARPAPARGEAPAA